MAVFRLPRLPLNWLSQPQLFERYWDETLKKLEEALNSILSLPVIEQAVADAQAAATTAQTAATTAQAAADNAQIAADDASNLASVSAAEMSITSSYVSNFTAPLVTVTSAGSVTIGNHDRVYGDSVLNPTVPVLGATISTPAVAGDVVRVYYDDPARAGGTVTYQVTIDPAAPPVQSGNRHSVGAVTVPAIGTNNGNVVRPPGYVEP